MLNERKTDWLNLRPKVTASPFYASLRPHLSDEALKMIYAERTAYAGANYPAIMDWWRERV